MIDNIDPQKILIVDDDEAILHLHFQYIANSFKHLKILKAKDGKEALVLFQETPCAVVVTDVEMPRMDGIELAHELRRLAPETEVIVVSGLLTLDITSKFSKINVAFVSKPVTQHLLVVMVRKAFEDFQSKIQTQNQRMLLRVIAEFALRSPSSEAINLLQEAFKMKDEKKLALCAKLLAVRDPSVWTVVDAAVNETFNLSKI